jgi:hypothetical protein
MHGHTYLNLKIKGYSYVIHAIQNRKSVRSHIHFDRPDPPIRPYRAMSIHKNILNFCIGISVYFLMNIIDRKVHIKHYNVCFMAGISVRK